MESPDTLSNTLASEAGSNMPHQVPVTEVSGALMVCATVLSLTTLAADRCLQPGLNKESARTGINHLAGVIGIKFAEK
jgi:hypothetical protein